MIPTTNASTPMPTRRKRAVRVYLDLSRQNENERLRERRSRFEAASLFGLGQEDRFDCRRRSRV